MTQTSEYLAFNNRLVNNEYSDFQEYAEIVKNASILCLIKNN